MEEYKLNKTDIDFLREYLKDDSPHSNHIARVELRDYFNDLLKKESFEVGKYYYYRDFSKFVFKVTDCAPFDTIFGGSVYGYGIDLDEDDFEENGFWVDSEDIKYSKEISEEEFLQYIIDHLDIHKGDNFIGVSGNLHKASREPYIRDGGVYVKNEKMLTVCLFKDGNIGRKANKEKEEVKTHWIDFISSPMKRGKIIKYNNMGKLEYNLTHSYKQDDDDLINCQVPNKSLILSPLSSKERCQELFDEWLKETF